MNGNILGIDTSLTGTGFALIRCIDGEWTGTTWTAGRKGKRKEPLPLRHERIRAIVSEILRVDLSHLTAAGIEQPAYGAPGGSTHDRSGLWWQVTHELMDWKVPVHEVNSSTRKKFATGSAGSVKNPVDKADVAMAAAKMWPEVEIRGNNAADALVIASVIAASVGLPVPFPMHQYRVDALAATRAGEAALVDWLLAEARFVRRNITHMHGDVEHLPSMRFARQVLGEETS